MMRATDLRGCYPAVITPMKDADGEIKVDFYHFYKLIEQVLEAGCSGIVIAGTTGQSATISHSEHIELVTRGAEYARGHAERLGRTIQVIGSAGSNSTAEALYLSREILRSTRLDAFLHVTGYYNNPPQEGLVRHYETLAKETGAKIVIYNVPGRTASYLEPDTLVHLARNANVIGLKQSVDFRNPGKFRDDTLDVIRRAAGEGFSVVSGEDDSLFAILELGGRGIITASGNIPEAARAYLDIVRRHGEGDKAGAERLQAALEPLVKAVFCRKNPVPLAAFFNSPLYLPLVQVRETKGGEEAHARIMDLIESSAPSLRKHHGKAG